MLMDWIKRCEERSRVEDSSVSILAWASGRICQSRCWRRKPGVWFGHFELVMYIRQPPVDVEWILDIWVWSSCGRSGNYWCLVHLTENWNHKSTWWLYYKLWNIMRGSLVEQRWGTCILVLILWLVMPFNSLMTGFLLCKLTASRWFSVFHADIPRSRWRRKCRRWCYALNCISPKFICWGSKLRCDSLGSRAFKELSSTRS